MTKPKLYPIRQVALDLLGEHVAVDEQIAALLKLEKFPAMTEEAPRRVDIEGANADAITTLFFYAILRENDRLPAVNEHGLPVRVPTTPLGFNELYITEEDGNKILKDAGYRVIWEPKERRNITKPTTGQWKIAYQTEATAFYLRTWRSAATPNQVNCSEYLAKWAREKEIKTDEGKFPAASTIRTHVLSPRYWTAPLKPKP